MNAQNTPLPSAPATPANGEVVVQVFGLTDVGRTREHNEDAFVVADLTSGDALAATEEHRHTVGDRGTLFMVADGMGGAAAGEIASQMAIEIVLRELQRTWTPSDDTTATGFARALRRAAVTANGEIHEFSGSHPEHRGMGTTATIAGLLGDTLYLAQVGDSRAYLVRDGVARQITKDQSLMQKLVEAGELTEDEAAVSDRRNIILQALGPDSSVKVDLTHQQVRRGDTLLLCSDGLSGQVTRDEIAQYVREETTLDALCRRLVDRANATGGPDNITVIAARFDGSALSAASETDGVGHSIYPLPDTGQTRAMRDLLEDTLELPVGEIVTAERRPPLRNDPLRELPPTAPAAPLPNGFASARRRRGMAVAIALLTLLVALGAWYVVRTAQKVTPREGAAPEPTTSVPQ